MKIDDVKHRSFIKYRTMHYLVDKIIPGKENNSITIDALFAICIKKNCNPKLYSNYKRDTSKFSFEKGSHFMTENEKDKLIKKIKEDHPDFDSKNLVPKQFNKIELTDSDCIEHLKEKGYLIYKQV